MRAPFVARALLGLVVATGACGAAPQPDLGTPGLSTQPFSGAWAEVPGIAPLVEGSSIKDFSEEILASPGQVYGFRTEQGLLSCIELFSTTQRMPIKRRCDYYTLDVTAPLLPVLAGTIEGDRVVAIADLDEDGHEDWVLRSGDVLWGGWQGPQTTAAHGQLEAEPVVLRLDGRNTLVAKGSCETAGPPLELLQLTEGKRTFEDVSALLPIGLGVNTQTVSAHCLPGGDCFLAAIGWGCRGAPPSDRLFMRAAGTAEWSPFTLVDMSPLGNAPMGNDWVDLDGGDAELYLSTDPEHVAFRISPGGHSERLKLPWAFYDSPVNRRPQIPWGIRHVELDGKTHVCAAHGFDDPLSQDVQRIGSETVNCYTRDEAGTWTEKTDPVLNRVGTVVNAGQYRFLHPTLSADGTQWMVVSAIVGFGDRSARFLFYREAGR